MSVSVSKSPILSIPESYAHYTSLFSSKDENKEGNKDVMQTVFHVGGNKFAPLFNGMTYLEMLQDFFNNIDIVNTVKKNKIPSDQKIEIVKKKLKTFDDLMRWNLAKDGAKVITKEGNFYHAQLAIHNFLKKFFTDSPNLKNPFPDLATVLNDNVNDNNLTTFVHNVIPSQVRSTDSIETFINVEVKDGKYKGSKYITLFNDKEIMCKITNIFNKRERTSSSNVVGNIEHFYYWSLLYTEHVKPLIEVVITEGEYKGKTYGELYQDLDACDILETLHSPSEHSIKGSIPHFLYWMLSMQPNDDMEINNIILIEGEHKGKKYCDVYEDSEYINFLFASYTVVKDQQSGSIAHFLEYVQNREGYEQK
jgi:hypothetical protein